MLIQYKPSRALGSMDSGQIFEQRVQIKHVTAAFSRYAAYNRQQATNRTESFLHPKPLYSASDPLTPQCTLQHLTHLLIQNENQNHVY